MTAPREFERDVRAFLEDGPAELPDRTYDAVRAGIDGTPQRVVIGPWRTTDVNTFLKLAAGAAAVVVAAVVGANLLGTSTGPGTIPSAPPTEAASPSPAATPAAPAPTAVARLGELPPDGTLLSSEPYAFYGDADGRTVRIEFTGADGWLSRGWFITTPDENAPQAALMVWGFGQIDLVPADPCHPDFATASVGGTVDDLLAALLAQELRTADPPTDVSVSGYAGKQIDSTIDVVDASGCDNGRLELWRLSNGRARWIFESMVQRLVVLDVDGIRVVLDASYPVGSSGNELLAVMSTLQVSVDPPTSAKDTGGLPPIGTELGTDEYTFAKGTLDGRTIAVAFRNAERWTSQGWYLSSPANEVGQQALAAWGLNGLPGPIGTVYADPCKRGGTGMFVEGGDESLTNAILGQRYRTSEPPVKVSIGGYQGVLLDSVIGAMDWSTCQGGHAEAWVSATGTARWIAPHTRQRIYVLDVEGTTLVLEGTYPDGIAGAQLFAMMDSMRITVD